MGTPRVLMCAQRLYLAEREEKIWIRRICENHRNSKKDGLLKSEFSVRRELSAAPVCDQIYLKLTF